MTSAVSTSIDIDSNVCKKDGLCAMVCPARMFTWSKGNVPALVDEDRCVLCGQCIAVCPSGAIAHSRLEAARFARIQDRKPVDPEAFMALLSQRRSVRDSITYDAPAAVFLYSPEDTSTPQQDCDAAVMYILMAAHAFGLGACWNGYLQHAAAGDHVKGFTKLREMLGIPKGYKVYGALTLGWPVVKLHSVPPRKMEIRWLA
ncbi:MAG: nitroreductase family protein [Deltaproteobacteria bacterium]|nr:nitroreductase family protein [Deltaproteobacteria bacterium]